MAREMKKRVTHFGLDNSKAIDENERILEAGRQQRQENREKKESGGETMNADATVETSTTEVLNTAIPVTEQPVTPSFSNDIAMNIRKPKGKKTENGITIYVPMEYYERIALMKMRTGVPIKDLALQAVIEFLDRNKM